MTLLLTGYPKMQYGGGIQSGCIMGGRGPRGQSSNRIGRGGDSNGMWHGDGQTGKHPTQGAQGGQSPGGARATTTGQKEEANGAGSKARG